MELSAKILSDVVVFSKYSRYLPELKRRETWQEIVDRNKAMHLKKFPQLSDLIEETFHFVYEKKALPSMRLLQFSGKAVEVNNARGYNCCFIPIDDVLAFSETMFLLLSGCGVGFSVQFHHIEKLPVIHKPQPEKPYGTRRYLIGDSIEGWADSIKVLMKSYFDGGPEVRFDYSDIRKKGTRLITSGGKAPGSEGLKICHTKIKAILNEKNNGDQLSSIEIHDIICIISDAVVAGGIRRSSLISLFSVDDEEMLSAKSGNWWETHPHRARANNSAVLVRHLVDEKTFSSIWERVKFSGCGEPGIYFTNDKDVGTNPCSEASLKPFQFCNLCEINCSNIVDQNDLNTRARVAAIIGTLQASYTDFHYLRQIWQRQTEKDALLGVGLTGIASAMVMDLDFEQAAKIVVETNKEISKMIGIKPSSRTTLIKPSGTSSLVLGCSSGIHAYHSKFYLRRMRVGKDEAIYDFFRIMAPDLLEDDFEKPNNQSIITLPIKSPEDAILRSESPIDLLERVKHFQKTWVFPGHNKGANTHTISATVSVKPDEWDKVGEWLWNNKKDYGCLSFLPFTDFIYKQPPFEECDEKTYDDLMSKVEELDFSNIFENDDLTEHREEPACAGGQCEVK